MNCANSNMKSRRNCSVLLSVTSPSELIMPGVNWMYASASVHLG